MKVLIMRSCDATLRSYNNFQWPESGFVAAPDWEATEACGNGLHGFLWGEGDCHLANQAADAKWLVVETDGDKVIDLGGKVKFPAGTVVYCGEAKGAAAYIQANGGAGKKVIHGTATAGWKGTATAGDEGTATAGDEGTATAGLGGVICIQSWNGKRYKTKIAQVKDEDGDGQLEPNQPYKLNEAGEFVLAENGGAA